METENRKVAGAGFTHAWEPEKTPLLDKLGLGIAKLIAPLLRVWGVDAACFVTLVDLRLKLGRRRSREYGRPAGKKGQLLTFVFALGAGAFAASLAYANGTDIGGLSLSLAMAWLMISLFQAMDVGSLLFDPAEGHVVLPTPTRARTAYLARIAHGLWGQGWVLTGTWIPMAVYWLFFRGAPLLAFLAGFGIVGLALISSSLLVAALLFLVRGRDPIRIQGAAVYAQIGLLAVFYILILLQGANPESLLQGSRMELGWWGLAFPPAWYGALGALLQSGGGLLTWAMAALALFVPLLALLGALQLVKQRHLFGATAGGSNQRGARGLWIGRLAKMLHLEPVCLAGFKLAGHLAGREHSFRQRTWPSLVYPLVFGVGNFWRHPELSQGMAKIWVLMPVILLPAILIHARYSRDPGAQWTLAAAPVAYPSQFLGGTRRFFLVMASGVPAMLFGTLWAIYAPIEQWPEILGTVGLSWAVANWSSVWLEHRMPFAEPIPTDTRPEGYKFALLAILIGSLAYFVTLVFRFGAAVTWLTAAATLLLGTLGWRRLGQPSAKRDRILRYARIRS